jgi:hypothetical protein
MPSITHEALILLFRNRPELAPELLRDALGVMLPPYAEARVEAADLSDVNPAEYRVPVVRDIEAARRDPELAVLSAMAHGKDEVGPAIALAALGASLGLDEERALLYSDVIMASLSEATRTAMEKLMASGNYEYQSDFAKTHQAKGRAEGEAKGEARGVLAVLDARGLVVSDDQKARILACTDLETLDRWIRKAVAITSIDELFTA